MWIDCEMTGLDLRSDRLIEIAALVTDAELNVLGEGIDVVIHADDAALDGMIEVVAQMHSRSGLIEEVRASTVDVAAAEEMVMDYIRTHVKQAKTAPLAGNSIATDRGFIARDMPTLDEYLHYRMIDVSSIKELCRRWYPRIYYGQPEKGLAHRALADLADDRVPSYPLGKRHGSLPFAAQRSGPAASGMVWPCRAVVNPCGHGAHEARPANRWTQLEPATGGRPLHAAPQHEDPPARHGPSRPHRGPRCGRHRAPGARAGRTHRSARSPGIRDGRAERCLRERRGRRRRGQRQRSDACTRTVSALADAAFAPFVSHALPAGPGAGWRRHAGKLHRVPGHRHLQHAHR